MNTITNESAKEFPVALEFMESLNETACETLEEALKKLNAPAEVLELLRHISELGYYFLFCGFSNGSFKTHDKDGFDAEGLTIETINSIARVGGTFHGAVTSSFPRKGTLLDGDK
jgi:hypothetical protein